MRQEENLKRKIKIFEDDKLVLVKHKTENVKKQKN